MAMRDDTSDDPKVLAEDEPVVMPELPLSLEVNTPQQMKALADPIRHRILGIIQNRPATAKQIADRLKMAPGTIGHHLQVLEAAGLAKVVARRLVRGIVAKYYTRTARIFLYNFPSTTTGTIPALVRFLTDARDELSEALVERGTDLNVKTAFPHARLVPERVAYFEQRLMALVDEFIAEPSSAANDDGMVYSLSVAFFQAPSYLQDAPATDDQRPDGTADETPGDTEHTEDSQ